MSAGQVRPQPVSGGAALLQMSRFNLGSSVPHNLVLVQCWSQGLTGSALVAPKNRFAFPQTKRSQVRPTSDTY